MFLDFANLTKTFVKFFYICKENLSIMVKVRIIGLLAASLLLSSCSVMCNKPNFKNTVWMAEARMFVADVGTQTTTYTLTLNPGNRYSLVTNSVLPPHPAMYMNPDGSVDTLPGFTSENTENGTYSFKKGILTLKSEEGETKELIYTDGVFNCSWLWGDKPAPFVKVGP